MMNKTFKTPSAPSALSMLTLAVAALVHGCAWADASEAQLKQTKLYGDVSIAEDSTDSWGPWSHFEPPAAGPGQAVPGLPKRAGELYRPLPQPQPEPPAAIGCVAGGVCGFAAVYQLHQVDRVSGPLNVYAALMTGDITQVDESIWPKAIRLTTTAFDPAVSVYKTDSGELLRSKFFEGPDGFSVGYGRSVVQTESRQFVDLNIAMDMASKASLETVQAVDGVRMTVQDYVLGAEEGSPQRVLGVDMQNAIMVLGRTTPAADMAALRADQATAVYLGPRLVDGVYAVRLDVQFGPGTWSGAWSGGRDGMVLVDKLPNDQGTFIRGRVGFSASGVIEGVNIRSTAVSTADSGATVSGSVRGAFFGPNAAAVGGVADITKTNPHAAVMTNQESKSVGYSNGRYVAPFLAINSKLTEKN